jgi:farnesyl diphosphate synthase
MGKFPLREAFMEKNIINIEYELANTASDLNDLVDKLLPRPNAEKEEVLYRAMRYSTLSEGQRLRPFLTLQSASLFGVDRSHALYAAMAVELIHTYSLIHDDLPAMDDDDWRRGQLSCHKKFDEATAILAGDALLTYAFEIFAMPQTHGDASVRLELIKSAAQLAGYQGMVGGQMIDLVAAKQQVETSEILRLQKMKTGALFALSCEAGAILGNAPLKARKALQTYAYNLGLIYQIKDDINDLTDDHADGRSATNTLIDVWGVDKAQKYVKDLLEEALTRLSYFDESADYLRVLAHKISSK